MFILLQKLLPQHLLSRVLGKLAATQQRWLSGPLIRLFMRAYGVSLAEAKITSASGYASFNDFFTRALAPGTRPIAAGSGILTSPVDGTVSQLGSIEEGTLLQAKGIRYSVTDLLGDEALAAQLAGGQFITLYLAPANYHRVHAPTDGQLNETIALPGKLYSVNDTTARGIPGLFARNQRLTCAYDSPAGPAALVFVGALIVASIETIWPEATSPYRNIQRREQNLAFSQGDELGRFLLGSTVVLCLPPKLNFAADIRPGAPVKMGQRLGNWPTE